MQLGDWIQKRRKYLGYTRRALTRQLNYSQDWLKKIEGGRRRLTPSAVSNLARWLEIPDECLADFFRFARMNEWQPSLENIPIQTEGQPPTFRNAVILTDGQFITLQVVGAETIRSIRASVQINNAVLTIQLMDLFELIRGVSKHQQ